MIPTTRVGDSMQLMGVYAVLAATKTIDGVTYELYIAKLPTDNRGLVRVFDADSGNIVTMKQYPAYAKAVEKYADAILIG